MAGIAVAHRSAPYCGASRLRVEVVVDRDRIRLLQTSVITVDTLDGEGGRLHLVPPSGIDLSRQVSTVTVMVTVRPESSHSCLKFRPVTPARATAPNGGQDEGDEDGLEEVHRVDHGLGVAVLGGHDVLAELLKFRFSCSTASTRSCHSP